MPQVVIGDILPYTQAIAIESQTVFGTNWTANAESDVVVYLTPEGDEPDDLTQILDYPSDYSVEFIGDQEQVQVTLVTPASEGDKITITRQTPADRMNLYANTNFTPSMLNNDFGILTLVDQQAQLVDQKVGPRYNYSATIVDVVDTILPILGANETWVKNNDNDEIITYELPSSGIAPSDATYITVDDETTDLPNSVPLSIAQLEITRLGAQQQALNMNSHLINNVTDPQSAQDAATKNYVDQTALTGTSVYAASNASLGTVVQSGAGVGATLTNAGTQATLTLDGVNPPVGSNVLIKNTATGMSAANEGIYTVTNAGSGSSNWVLTRAISYDTATEINNTGLIVIQNGTLAGTAWYNTNTIVTVDSTSFNYAKFGNNGTVTSVTFTGDGVVLSSTPSTPVTSSGTLTATLNSQNANKIFAGPASGGAANPSFRNLVSADLSNISSSSYSPELKPSSGAFGAITYTAQDGQYTQIGNIVFVSIEIIVNTMTIGTAANQLLVTLPVSSAGSTVSLLFGTVSATDSVYTGPCYIQAAGSTGVLINTPSSSSSNIMVPADAKAGSSFRFNGFYFTS